jgi:hypothetical protein
VLAIDAPVNLGYKEDFFASRLKITTQSSTQEQPQSPELLSGLNGASVRMKKITRQHQRSDDGSGYPTSESSGSIADCTSLKAGGPRSPRKISPPNLTFARLGLLS